MSKKNQGNQNNGLKILLVCGVIAVLLIIGCVFFPDALFGWLL